MKKKVYDGFRAKGYTDKQSTKLTSLAMKMINQGMDLEGSIEMALFDYGVTKSNNREQRWVETESSIVKIDEETGEESGGIDDLEPGIQGHIVGSGFRPTDEDLDEVKNNPAKCSMLIRAVHGLSQSQLGERLGCSKQMVSQIETGERKPPKEMLKKMRNMAREIGPNDAFF